MAEVHAVETLDNLDLKSLFLGGHWREAVFLTYSFELPFFESYLLPILSRNGCRAVAIGACASKLGEALPGWLIDDEVREAGRSYTLSGVHVPGAFHPKLMLAVGEREGAVLVGSGNLSHSGLGGGGELFTAATWRRDEEVPPLAREAWAVCREVARSLSVDPLLGDRVDAIARRMPALAVAPEGQTLLHNLRTPILPQLFDMVGDERVDEVVAWSPFTDRRLTALSALVERLRPLRLTLAVQPGLTVLDGSRLAEVMAEQADVAWRVVGLNGHDAEQGPARRLIHAKGILVALKSRDEILLGGSPNLSRPALLQTAAEANFELATVHRGVGLRDRLLARDSYVSLGEPVDETTLVWTSHPDAAIDLRSRPSVRLLGARLEGEMLNLTIDGWCPDGTSVLLNRALEVPLDASGVRLAVAVPSGVQPRMAELIWPGGRSEPVSVADVAALAARLHESEGRRHTPLEVLDYGGDADLLALLDELAALAIITTRDIDRMLRGQPVPTAHEEAEELEGREPPVQLSDIDFDRVRQHPRGQAYETVSGDPFGLPRIQLWLDEVVRQFDSLRERQLLRAVQPSPSDEEQDIELEPTPAADRVRWRVSTRIRVRVRNRLRRYVDGVSSPGLWSLVPPDWMGKNYALFLELLYRLWRRADDPQTRIVSVEDLAPLVHDLLRAFWGDDLTGGYWQSLSEDEALTLGMLFEEHHTEALSMAVACRLLAVPSELSPDAPFIIAGFVRAVEPLGLLSDSSAEDALIYLEQMDRAPAWVLAQLQTAQKHFSWNRYVGDLARRHGARWFTVDENVGHEVGRALHVEIDNIDDLRRQQLKLLVEWIRLVRTREPARMIFRMIWNDEEVLVYDAKECELYYRRRNGAGRLQLLASGATLDDLPGVDWSVGPKSAAS
jgi:hypothetical protein